MPLVLTRAIFLGVLFSSAFTAAEGPSRPNYKYSDAHLHYVNFFQQTAGTDALLKGMDKANVEHAMIAGLPIIKKWADTEPQKPKFVFADDANVYWYALSDEIVARAVGALSPAQTAAPVYLRFQSYRQECRGTCEENAGVVPGFMGRHR